MLVLERKQGQSIFINTSDGLIEVHISSHQGQRIKVGIDAPASVIILREELMPTTVLRARSMP